MTTKEIEDELYRMLSDVVNGGYPKRTYAQQARYKEAVERTVDALDILEEMSNSEEPNNSQENGGGTMTLDEAIKHCEEVAKKNENEANFGFGNACIDRSSCLECAKEHRQLARWLRELKQLREQMSSPEKPNKWIPLIKRPMTEEEREEYKGMTGIEETMILNCPLPEDGEEVFISYGGYVCVDTFHDDDGCYFEDVEIDEVEAWMPLPLPYKAENEE